MNNKNKNIVFNILIRDSILQEQEQNGKELIRKSNNLDQPGCHAGNCGG
ncbi:unnamed protein product, partial [Vitis vinifera]|uniref:Uncharacterized protein n=1 Tax=Vitis vinifera TaxID=29760 RepID=D7T0X5_VITVI